LLATLLLALGSVGASAADTDFPTDMDFPTESADAVNEGTLRFLEAPPAKPVHHHQNRIRIDASSLSSGWVALAQCHDHLDAVPRTQITFREGFVRDLKIESSSGIERAWVEGASVQLSAVAPGARLCLSAQTRALRALGDGRFKLVNGPYMRKFLDGYYPMLLTLEVEYPAHALDLVRIDPAPQAGLNIEARPGNVRLDAMFEGELRTAIEFEQARAAE
jgi:hypothetical protein